RRRELHFTGHGHRHCSVSWKLMHELLRGLRVTDSGLQLGTVPTRALKYETHVVRAIRLHGAVEEELHQHVLLGMAAAELVHIVKRRTHEVERPRVLAAAMRQNRLADRQRDLADDL